MALIGLHDSERDHMPRKTFPNFALMKIAAYWRRQGAEVEWWTPLNNENYSRVYSSKVFSFTPENPYLPPYITERGGTGYGLDNIFGKAKLPPEIDKMPCDYSIYPSCDYAVGFLTRGCPNKCDFCVAWRKEGSIKPYAKWQDIVRPDSKKLILMDNNILSCEHGINQLAELSETDFKLDANQGLDITLLNEDIVKILAKIKWIEYIRFSCDKDYQLPYFERMTELFREYKIALSRVFIYVLVRENLQNADFRVQSLNKIYRSFNIYAQAERGEKTEPSRAMLEFANRYVYGKRYKLENWVEYCERTGFKG